MNAHRKYGDLLITLTSQYNKRYSDQGSGASMDGTFWHPKPEGNFRPVGSVIVAGYDDINGKRASMLVADGGNNAVAPPTDYSWLWDDDGSGAYMDGAVWRPIAPKGYVALGDVVTSRGKPSTNDIWCVRADLVATGVFAGACTWEDKGSGGSHDIAAWQVDVGEPAGGEGKAVMAPDTFFSVDNYSSPPNAGLARVLLVPVAAAAFSEPS